MAFKASGCGMAPSVRFTRDGRRRDLSEVIYNRVLNILSWVLRLVSSEWFQWSMPAFWCFCWLLAAGGILCGGCPWECKEGEKEIVHFMHDQILKVRYMMNRLWNFTVYSYSCVMIIWLCVYCCVCVNAAGDLNIALIWGCGGEMHLLTINISLF